MIMIYKYTNFNFLHVSAYESGSSYIEIMPVESETQDTPRVEGDDGELEFLFVAFSRHCLNIFYSLS